MSVLIQKGTEFTAAKDIQISKEQIGPALIGANHSTSTPIAGDNWHRQVEKQPVVQTESRLHRIWAGLYMGGDHEINFWKN